jgi:hypothetical protein
MRKATLLIVVIIALMVPIGADAQCAMCRAALESSESGIKPEAVNDGIVYLMIIPYILVGLIAYAIYKSRIKPKE